MQSWPCHSHTTVTAASCGKVLPRSGAGSGQEVGALAAGLRDPVNRAHTLQPLKKAASESGKVLGFVH